MLLLITLSVFVSVLLLIGVFVYPALSSREIVRERVANLIDRNVETPSLVPTRKKWQTMLANLGLKVKVKPADLGTYRALLITAGFRGESVRIFLGTKLLLTVLLPATYLMFFVVPYGKSGNRLTLLVALALAITGYLFPTACLSRLAEDRKTEIFHSLPDVLDLLTVCVEAGLSLDMALRKTVDQFVNRKNPLIKEINRVTLEIAAGRPRSEAFRGLAERTGLDDIKSFVSLTVQTEKFGTSMGKTLRTYSDSLRTRRKQLAEERAAKTGVKMLFPLTFCVFPALLIVILAPAVFRIYNILCK
jgi:tight adherence protein C